MCILFDLCAQHIHYLEEWVKHQQQISLLTTHTNPNIIMTTAQSIANKCIDNCLDVNASWRETMNELVVLHTFDCELDLEDTPFEELVVRELEEHGMTLPYHIDYVYHEFMNEYNCSVSYEWVINNRDFVETVLYSNGCDEDVLNDWLVTHCK